MPLSFLGPASEFLPASVTPTPLTALLASADDVACLRLKPRQWLLARGPFRRAAQAPEGAAAFYVNDFDLSDPLPWRLPEEMWESDELPVTIGEASSPVPLTWQPPNQANFASVFHEIVEGLTARCWEKAVPTVTETATLARRDLPTLLHHFGERLLAQADSALHHPFFFREGERGFVGLTPERLFSRQGRRLRTMALAGTARPTEVETFAHDAKQIREHEMVVAMLREQLAPWGHLTVHPREVLDLGGLIHFLTRFEVTLDRGLSAEDLIRGLHPTPALGMLPRTPENLAALHQWRVQLGTPPTFAAPFGVQWQGELHFAAAIRGVWWEPGRLRLPAGCGLVEGSALDHEWRELGLKRRWVKQAFGIES